MQEGILFPNENYRRTLEKMVNYFRVFPGVFAVVLTGSLVRGKAVEGSCIDLCVFLDKEEYERLALGVKARAKAYSLMGGEVCYYAGRLKAA